MEIQLLLPNRKPIPVTAELTETGLMIYSDERKITLGLRGELWRLFERPDPREWRVAEQPEPIPAPPPASPENWDWLTPEFVIQYFEQSPHLSSMAADVRTALAPLCEATADPGPAPQLAADLDKLWPIRAELIDSDGNPKLGAKTRVARELGGQPGGSFYYTRVLPVIEALSSASTDPERAKSGKFERSAA